MCRESIRGKKKQYNSQGPFVLRFIVFIKLIHIKFPSLNEKG